MLEIFNRKMATPLPFNPSLFSLQKSKLASITSSYHKLMAQITVHITMYARCIQMREGVQAWISLMCFTAYHNPDRVQNEEARTFLKSVYPHSKRMQVHRKLEYNFFSTISFIEGCLFWILSLTLLSRYKFTKRIKD